MEDSEEAGVDIWMERKLQDSLDWTCGWTEN